MPQLIRKESAIRGAPNLKGTPEVSVNWDFEKALKKEFRRFKGTLDDLDD